MKCITSPALDNVEIAMYVDGEADEAVIAHIQQCPFCSERARQWTLLQNGLRKQSYRIDCPTPMELGEYHLGYLPDPPELAIARHLQDCLLCRREVAILEDFLSSLAPETGLLGAAKVLIARLMGVQEENGLASVVPALRGASKGPLTFEVDGFVIVLDLQPTHEGMVDILGQVAADDQDQWTDAVAELRRNSELQFSTTVDDLGAFRFEGITAGEQELRIIPKGRSPVLVSNFTV
jgi:hypothetical protein